MRRLLLLDDDPLILHALQRTLRQCKFDVELRIEVFTDPAEALVRAAEIDIDLAISDYHMPAMNGIQFLNRFRQIQPDAVRMVLSASTEFNTAVRAINEAEVFRFIPKPWQWEELQQTIVLALARRDQNVALTLEQTSLSAQELALRKLEADEPGITKVNWGADGSVQLD
ncbi:response regulator [Actimicrobium sp. CCC2.4]|uniref:response regulator n=1 Tax=Actimicrobium sp. CCC2.4 TaxID=3048606 RepID=UPI002AC9C95E|nr:response regulator [Actimicrobium sp. CCC2.4]MEB0136897.1 response regulator [Actimicrobium sp. CCC2.4]WPX33447.1 response regulator [Actimicrobium sp. CCC2.4]